jgi:hypothetical protein
MPYKETQSKQQYLLQRKVKSKVQSKLKQRSASGGAKSAIPAQPVAPLQNAPEEEEQAKLPAGYKATMHYKGEGINITAAVRYETEKTDPLIKTVHVASNGEVVHREYVGPKKEEKWLDDNGKEYNKAEVRTAQVMPDGTLKPIVIEKTKDINVEPVAPEVMDEFLPYSFLEVWGESESDDDGLRKTAYDLLKSGKIGAIKEFSHGYGKVYVGFMKPILSKDGKHFGVEIMLSENKRKRRRLMLVDKSAIPKAEKAEIPKLW